MKYRLLAPGPTPVPDRVLSAMGKSIYHHRTPAFEKVFEKCQQGLKWLLGTEQETLILASSGTGGFEACIQNCFSPGDTVIAVTAGKFGQRWAQMGKIFGLNMVEVDAPWGQSVRLEDVHQALNKHPETKGVFCVASETSTGVRQPYEAIGQMVSTRSDCIFVLDAITAVGVWDICPERDHVDVLITGSQKALMLPPGLAFISLSPKAWKHQEKAQLPRYYFDLAKERKSQSTRQSAYTPAVSLMTGLAESLEMMQEEGKNTLFARHKRMAAGTRAGVQALGLELFAHPPSDGLTSVCSPPSIPPNGVYTALRDRAHMTIAGGQDQLKGKIFRIAHMGHMDELDIFTVLCALEVVLRQMGYAAFNKGASVEAASSFLTEGFIQG